LTFESINVSLSRWQIYLQELSMELFGGLMVMLWMIGFFLTVIWFILPFVIFSIKGRVEETLIRVEKIDERLVAIEKRLVDISPTEG